MNGARTKNNQEHKNNNNKKLKLKGCLCSFSGRWRGRGGGGNTTIIGNESGGRRSEALEAEAIYIELIPWVLHMQQKKPSNDVPSTRIRLFLKQQLHELSADSLVSCERKALPSKNAFSKVS